MGSTRSITAEIIVAIVAIISIFLFLDVPVLVKIGLILTLAVVGGVNFAFLVGWTTRAKWKLEAWRSKRRIRKFPSLISDLYRLNGNIHRVLYERNSENPSLALQGLETVMILSKELGADDSSLVEFQEKFDIIQSSFNPTFNKIMQNSRGHRWTTLEFIEMVLLINLHMDALGKVFNSVYRDAELLTERANTVPLKAQSLWKDFVKDYNQVLQEWRTYTERIVQGLGSINPSRAEFAKDI